MKEEKRMKRLLGLLLAVMVVMIGGVRVRLRRTRTQLCQIG